MENMVEYHRLSAPGGGGGRRRSRPGMPDPGSHQIRRALLRRARRPTIGAHLSSSKTPSPIKPPPNRSISIMPAVPSAAFSGCWRTIPPPLCTKRSPTFTIPLPGIGILKPPWRKTPPAGRRRQPRKSPSSGRVRRTCGVLVDMLAAGELPLRVTHNDTKLNNVMLERRYRPPGLRHRSGHRHARSLPV